jgi:catechol 2,3-dioxygenase-like lactoylglutathione lyase family enzyme
MFSHVFLGVSDFEQALAFYRALMKRLGFEERFCERSRPWAGWHSAGGERPLFLIGTPYNQQAHHCGNGQMLAFLSQSRKLFVFVMILH